MFVSWPDIDSPRSFRLQSVAANVNSFLFFLSIARENENLFAKYLAGRLTLLVLEIG